MSEEETKTLPANDDAEPGVEALESETVPVALSLDTDGPRLVSLEVDPVGGGVTARLDASQDCITVLEGGRGIAGLYLKTDAVTKASPGGIVQLITQVRELETAIEFTSRLYHPPKGGEQVLDDLRSLNYPMTLKHDLNTKIEAGGAEMVVFKVRHKGAIVAVATLLNGIEGEKAK